MIRDAISEAPSWNTQGRSMAEAKVIAANVDFYRQIAAKYDTSEGYLFDPLLQQRLEADLDKIGSYFVSLGRTPSCLECGGGTGNLTLKICARGWKVTVVDVSEEMLRSLRAKARAKAFSPTLVVAPIERFLVEARETYDLVAFSAVLHHLYCYASVVERAALHVCPGGFFYSNLDPVIPKRMLLTRFFDSADIALAKLFCDPGDVLPGVARRMRKVFLPRDVMFNRAVASPGDIAEYHARSGIDDIQMIDQLQRAGFLLLDHCRYPSGRTRAGRLVNRYLRLLELCKIIAQREPRKIS